MAQFRELRTLSSAGQTHISQFYQQNNIPIFVREKFASLIEPNFKEYGLDSNNPDHFPSIKAFIRNLIAEIQFSIEKSDDSCYWPLCDARDTFQATFANDELAIFKALDTCLQEEIKLLNTKDDFLIHLEYVLRVTSEYSAQLNDLQSAMHGPYFYISNEMLAKLHSIVNQDTTYMSLLTTQVVNKITEWKNYQRKIANGAIEEKSILDLQKSCETLAQILWTLYNQINIAEQIATFYPAYNLTRNETLKAEISALLENLLTSSLVVEKHPKQVIGKNTRICEPIVIRHLCAHKILSRDEEMKLIMKMIDSSTAEKLRSEEVSPELMVDIIDSSCTLKYNEESKSFSATCVGCKIGSFDRNDKKGKEDRVTEEKRYFYFETSLTFCQRQLKLWTTSLPVVITSHCSQDTNGAGTIFWDNNFAVNLGGEPFEVEDSVPRKELFEALDQFFCFKTGRNLSDGHIKVLIEKLESTQKTYKRTSTDVLWNDFWRNNLPGHKFSFWTWFHEIVLLIEACLQDIWMNPDHPECILGFIDRDEAEDLLYNLPPGTFLTRFSDSVEGGISIALVQQDGSVGSASPLDRKTLTSTLGSKNAKYAFAEKIMGEDKLTCLYSKTKGVIAKENCFEKFGLKNKDKPKRTYIPWDARISHHESTRPKPKQVRTDSATSSEFNSFLEIPSVNSPNVSTPPRSPSYHAASPDSSSCHTASPDSSSYRAPSPATFSNLAASPSPGISSYPGAFSDISSCSTASLRVSEYFTLSSNISSSTATCVPTIEHITVDDPSVIGSFGNNEIQPPVSNGNYPSQPGKFWAVDPRVRLNQQVAVSGSSAPNENAAPIPTSEDIEMMNLHNQ